MVLHSITTCLNKTFLNVAFDSVCYDCLIFEGYFRAEDGCWSGEIEEKTKMHLNKYVLIYKIKCFIGLHFV